MKMKFHINKKYWSKRNKVLVAKAIKYAVYRYGIQDIDLVAKLGKPNKKAWGYSDDNEVSGYKIWIYPASSQGEGILEILSTVFHEMTHIKQFHLGELDLNRLIPRWKGKKCKADYKNQPWEIEAHEMEAVLLKEFLDIQVNYIL
jgi:hypothetical protein